MKGKYYCPWSLPVPWHLYSDDLKHFEKLPEKQLGNDVEQLSLCNTEITMTPCYVLQVLTVIDFNKSQ